MECAHLFIRGEQQQHERKLEEQYDHIDKYLEMINEHNPTVLPALVEPKQLLVNIYFSPNRLYGS